MKRPVFVLLALLLSLLTVLAGGRAPLAAAQSGPTASTTSLETQTPVEVPSLRTRYSRTYQVGDQFHAHITLTPQNYQAADGSWQVIDDTIVPTTTSGFAYQNKADNPSVLLPSSLGTGPVRLTSGSSWVSFALTGHSSLSNAASLTGSTATYTIPTGSITETASPSGLTEALTLSSTTAPSTYTWNLATSSDLTPEATVSGGIDFLNSANQVVLTMPAPVMTDAAGNVSYAVHLSLSQSALGQSLTLTADPTWLADPARVYPVTIDPSTYAAPLTQGCTLNESSPTTSQCTSGPYVISGGTGPDPEQPQIPNGYNDENTLLQFDLSGIPSTMQILDTTLGLHVTAESIANAPANVQLHAVTRSWTTGATWNTSNGTTAWTNPGGDYATTPVCTTPITGTPPNWLLLSCNAIVQNWVDGTTANNGFAVLTYINDSLTVDSPATSSANEPYLDVAYSPWLGTPSQFTLDSGVNVFNGNLVLGSTDLAMPGIGLPLTLSRVFNGLMAGGPGPFGNGWSFGGRPNGYLYPFSDGNLTYYAPDGSRWPFQMVQTVSNGETFTSYQAPAGIDADLVNTGTDTYTLTFHSSQEVLHFYGNRVTSDVDRSGNTISYGYDSSGRLTTIIDTQGRTTTLSYTSPVSSSLISEITDPAGRTYQYTYDSNQNLISYTDPNGKVTQYSYDPSRDDELTQITDPDGNVVQFTYASLKVTSITQVNTTPGSANPTTTFTYNSGNTVVTDPNNHQTTYTYDPLGRVTAVKDARGYTWQTSWTSDNNVASTTTPSGHTTSYSYDGNNNLTGITLPTSPTTSESCAYANASFPYQPSSCTDERGKTTTYGYDSAGRVNSVTDADDHTSSVIYNSNGTVQSETDANNHTTSHTYSTSGTSIGLPLQDTPPAPKGTTSYVFDDANREYTVTDGNGKLTTFTYNADDELIGETFGGQVSITYTYDNDGNTLSMTDGTGTTYYRYNSLNELTSELDPTGATITCPGSVTATVCYSYDLAGNLASKTDSGGTVTYGYDPNDEINAVTDRQNGHYTLGYNQDGEQTSLAFPNGVTESMGYTSVGQLSSISAAKPGSGPLTSFSYSYVDPSTNLPTSLPFSRTDTSGNTTTYGYDNTGSLTGVTLKNGGGTTLHSYGYGYDNAGNLTNATVDGTGTTFSYNAADELTGAIGGLNRTYTYDGNGDRTSSSDGTSITVNAAGQLTSVTPPGQSAVSYTYSGPAEGMRTGAGNTKYQYDGTGLNKQTDSLGDTYFTTLPDGSLLSETVPSGSYAGTYYYLDDGAGNVAAIMNSSGQVADSYSYDPLGNATSSGSVPNPFTFQGWMYDSQTGYYYTGSDYYDPASGQSFGCTDKGSVDPGEDCGCKHDSCGEDEPAVCGGLCFRSSGLFQEYIGVPTGWGCLIFAPIDVLLTVVCVAFGSSSGQRQMTQWGWRHGPRWNQAVKVVEKGGTITQIFKKVPTKQEGIWLVDDAHGVIDRIEGPHEPPNPINFCHINYHIGNIRGHLKIQTC